MPFPGVPVVVADGGRVVSAAFRVLPRGVLEPIDYLTTGTGVQGIEEVGIYLF